MLEMWKGDARIPRMLEAFRESAGSDADFTSSAESSSEDDWEGGKAFKSPKKALNEVFLCVWLFEVANFT
jgi:hypothetical protein